MWQGTLAFIGGILYLAGFPQLPDSLWPSFFPVLLLLAVVQPAYRLLWLFLAGLLWAQWHAAVTLSDELSPELEKQDLLVTGTVEQVDERADGLRLILQAEQLQYRNRQLPFSGRIRLSWHRALPSIHTGQQWQLLVRLKRPRGYRNPGAFDYERWLFEKGIRATGYVRHSPLNQLQKLNSRSAIDALREDLLLQLKQKLPAARHTAQLAALTLGDRSGFTGEDWQLLRDTGTSHLMAISGLHIGLVSGMVYLLFRYTWRRLGTLSLRLPAQRFALLPAMAFAWFYAMLAGFTIPTQRALLMLLFVMATALVIRRLRIGRVFLLTLMGVLLMEPWSILSAGFWLSFTAVASILYAFSARPGGSGLWWQQLRVHWVVMVGLIPVLLWQFQQVPLLSAFANIIAVPLTAFLVVPLAMLGVVLLFPWPWLSTVLFSVADRLLQLLWLWLEGVVVIGEHFMLYAAPGPVVLVLATVGFMILFLPRGWPSRWMGLLCFMPLWFSHSPQVASGSFLVHVLDVGQGLSVLVQTRNHVLLFDTGPAFPGGFNTVDTVIRPFMRHQGIERLDAVVLSHSDNDHAGGIQVLLQAVDVQQILAGGDVMLPGARPCLRGAQWQWDGVSFHVLHPSTTTTGSENNRSCVLQIRAGEHSLLLTGDIESRAETQLLEYYGSKLQSTVMLAPHHGSKTSSSWKFIEQVDPLYVVFPAGYKNRFAFPHQQVLVRYQRLGSNLLQSSREGYLRFRLSPGTEAEAMLETRFRGLEQRFWHSLNGPLSP